ncbi:MAG: MurR/RpiR family transcriptional regulator [Candidatus Alectryocaccobium sp.]|jgi:DNA-binding MurR/RpiR family transcriptional regulator|nr:MurR/RpiR family transcriptional regulator [Lachnospiraceae bacterium]MDY6221250.1 MurR/RpiR family transcriptional regulator [Candidatus Alectryocaccobium sp.]
MAQENLFTKIQNNYMKFSKGQKKIADYILSDYEQAVFMTAVKLGKKVGVSESTTVRFAVELGYEGYPEFRQALEEMVLNRLNSVQRMEVAYSNINEDEILDRVLLSDIDKIKHTLETISKDAFKMAVKSILSAKRVYLIGIRSCAPLASFLDFYLKQILDDVRLITTNNASEIFEQMIHLNEDDVVIGISFPRYSMRTLKAMEFANKRNAKLITITDSQHSPINLYSSCTLLAKSDMASIVDSLVAPLSVINALVVALCLERKDKVMATLSEMEKLWEEYQVYNRDDMDPLNEFRMKRNADK